MAKYKTEDLIKNLYEKIDKNHESVDKRLDSIEKVIIVQEQNLQTHMKRSDMLETMYIELKENEIKPLTKHVNQVEGGLKLLGVISLLLGIVAGIIKIFGLN